MTFQAGPDIGDHAPTATARHNNFDFLRLFAASAVLIGHSYDLMGYAQPLLFGTQLSAIGVNIFFSISGYLVAGSWMADPSLPRFFLRRSLRIFPALVAVVLLAAFVAGPLLSSLPASQYFSNPLVYDYLRNIGLYIQYPLPGVFAHNTAAPNAVNGSLWTLPPEFFMYMVTPAVFLFRTRSSIVFGLIATGFAVSATYLLYYDGRPPLVVYATSVPATLAVGCLFAGGAMLRALEPKIPFRLKYAAIVLAAYIVVSYFNVGLARFPISFVVSCAFPYLIVTLGRQSTPGLSKAGAWGDFSYGLYLYAFPIQQIIAERYPVISGRHAAVLAFAMTLPCAVASWHLIEKRALSWKPTRAPVRYNVGLAAVG